MHNNIHRELALGFCLSCRRLPHQSGFAQGLCQRLPVLCLIVCISSNSAMQFLDRAVLPAPEFVRACGSCCCALEGQEGVECLTNFFCCAFAGVLVPHLGPCFVQAPRAV